MPDETPTYDLMMLLSTEVDEERRAKILRDVEAAIADAKGSIVHKGDWGPRPLAYKIAHQPDAEYHLLQFTGPPALLKSLSHNLRITDGVLRHRIIKLRSGTPPPPAPERMAVAAGSAASSGSAGEGGRAGAAAPSAAGEKIPTAAAGTLDG